MDELMQGDKMLLRLVARHRSYREMASHLGVALGTIQNRLRRLKRAGYIVGPRTRKARMLTLSQKGQYALRKQEPLE